MINKFSNFYYISIATGRLRENLAYSEKVTGRTGFQGEEEFGAEVLMQTARNNNQSMLTAEALFQHLEMVKKVKDMKSITYGQYVDKVFTIF